MLKVRLFPTLLCCILLILSVGTVHAQGVIKGKIIDDASGQTMIGVNVVIKGTTTGTTTGLDGTFELKVDQAPPIELIISFVGYKKVEYTVNSFDENIKLKLELDNVMLDAVEVVDTRISDRQKQAALTVESLDVIAIKDAPSGNFYESLANLKGVDLTSASLGFKVINTRGFNSTSPVRSLQLIDGVDNQSPGLNFSLGNFLGASDLDVMKVDIIAGASSAFYGPGAFNGVVNMTTKDPFLFPGLSVSAKVGERNLTEFAARWAQVIKNKAGEEKFGYKLNAFYFSALDWEAENYDPITDSEVPATNPGGFNAVNIYGDEGDGAPNNDFSDPFNSFQDPGLGQFFPTGYREIDLADYNTENLKLNGAFHYKIKNDLQAIYSVNYGYGTTVYQGENRFSLNNIQFLQNRLELKKDNKWFIRAYATHEDAGDSYDIVTTAVRLKEAAIPEGDWNSNYGTEWIPYSRSLERLPDYPRWNSQSGQTIEEWHEQEYLPFIAQYQDSLVKWHNLTRAEVDNDPRTGEPFIRPGTARFDSAFNAIRTKKFTDGGSLFYDRSALYHVQGEYKFQPEWAEITVGGNMRWYTPDSRGTIFSDTLQYERARNDSGEIVVVDSAYRQITNREFGVYVGIEKKLLAEEIKLNATLRMDKNENFDYLFSPAISVVWSPDVNHTFRASFSSAIRNPTLADQYLNYDVGRATLLGNLQGFDSLITIESVGDYFQTFNPDTLDFFNVDPISPERVRTVEVGYRGTLFNKVYVDASGYYSWYDDFIGFVIGLDAGFDLFGNISDPEVYRLAANAESQVITQGFNIGVNYYFVKKFTLTGNYSYNKLTSGDDDPIIPAFNTPEHKYNIGINGRDITLPFIDLKHFGFGINYKWIDGFRFEGSPQFTGTIDAYDLVDAQINLFVPKLHTTFKAGASNLLNNQVYQVYGGPRVGRLAYFSVLFDLSTR